MAGNTASAAASQTTATDPLGMAAQAAGGVQAQASAPTVPDSELVALDPSKKVKLPDGTILEFSAIPSALANAPRYAAEAQQLRRDYESEKQKAKELADGVRSEKQLLDRLVADPTTNLFNSVYLDQIDAGFTPDQAKAEALKRIGVAQSGGYQQQANPDLLPPRDAEPGSPEWNAWLVRRDDARDERMMRAFQGLGQQLTNSVSNALKPLQSGFNQIQESQQKTERQKQTFNANAQATQAAIRDTLWNNKAINYGLMPEEKRRELTTAVFNKMVELGIDETRLSASELSAAEIFLPVERALAPMLYSGSQFQQKPNGTLNAPLSAGPTNGAAHQGNANQSGFTSNGSRPSNVLNDLFSGVPAAGA